MLTKTSPLIEIRYSKMYFAAANAGLLLFYILIGTNGEKYLQQFKNVCLFSLVSIFTVLMFNYMGYISNTYKTIACFNGLIFVVTTMIFISGGRHGAFKND